MARIGNLDQIRSYVYRLYNIYVSLFYDSFLNFPLII
jgi:hypothetical protein